MYDFSVRNDVHLGEGLQLSPVIWTKDGETGSKI
jgi:hypothetical protein